MSDNSNPQPPASTSPVPSEQPKTIAEIIGQVAPEALKKIPESEQGQIVITKETFIRSFHSGPLPHPETLAAYSQLIPNGADRIMKMAEAQTAHRIEIEKTVINSQKNQAFRGQLFGLAMGLVGIGAGTFAAINGQAIFGGVICGGTLVSLVVAFVQSREKQEEELSEKRQQMQSPQSSRKKNRKK